MSYERSNGGERLFGLTEVGVVHGFAGGQPGLVVVAQQLVQEVEGLRTDQVLVLTVDESLPPLTRMSAQQHTHTPSSDDNLRENYIHVY